MTNPDEAEISTRIKQLEGLLRGIRGNQHGPDGNYKLPHQYHEADVKHKKFHREKNDGLSASPRHVGMRADAFEAAYG